MGGGNQASDRTQTPCDVGAIRIAVGMHEEQLVLHPKSVASVQSAILCRAMQPPWRALSEVQRHRFDGGFGCARQKEWQKREDRARPDPWSYSLVPPSSTTSRYRDYGAEQMHQERFRKDPLRALWSIVPERLAGNCRGQVCQGQKDIQEEEGHRKVSARQES